MDLKIFKKNRLDIELLIQDTVNYTVDQFAQSKSNFTVASAYGQIIFVLQNLAQLILYYIEDSITELNINTATRSNSIYGLARLAGHNPTRAISAIGEIAVRFKSNAPLSEIAGGYVIIPNYTRIKCVNNGLTYLVNLPGDEIRVPVSGSNDGIRLNIVQGTIETQIFTGTGTSLQTYSVNFPQTGMVEHYNVSVFVNGEKWQRYDALYDMPREKKGFVVKTGINSGIDIYFGNTNAGLPPQLGAEVRVEYVVSNGEIGNLNLSQDDEAVWKWDDPGYTIFGDEIDMNEFFGVKTTQAPDFGSNAEPLALTKLIAPKTSRSYVLANPDNYIIFLEKFNQFSIIDAYQTKSFNNPLNLPGVPIPAAPTPPIQGLTVSDDYSTVDMYDDKIIYLFLVPDVRKRLRSDENYFSIDESRFKLTNDQKFKVLDLIERSGSKVVGTEVFIVDPKISRFVINVAVIIFSDVSEDQVRLGIEQKLSDYFLTIRRRDRIPRSDLISIIEAVPGVDSVNVSIISEIDERQSVLLATGGRNSSNAEAPRIDEFGDIIIRDSELPIIRGGWSDRNGTEYASGIDPEKPCALNVMVKDIVYRSYNTDVNASNKSNLRT